MNEDDFMKLVKNDKYQAFLFVSPVPFPLNFALHGWFVINLKGELNRWEFGIFYKNPHPNKIGVSKNFFKPTEGMNKFWWRRYPRFNGKLINFISGGENSVAKKMALFIENNSYKYPLRKTYKLTGPNSNTFIGWIIEKFPHSNFKLPLNAFGWKYKVKE